MQQTSPSYTLWIEANVGWATINAANKVPFLQSWLSLKVLSENPSKNLIIVPYIAVNG